MKNPFAWYRDYKQGYADHVAAWKGWAAISESGLSRFQEICEPQLCALLKELGAKVACRTVEGESEPWILLRIADQPFAIEIYVDQVNLYGTDIDYRLEEWDGKTPDELIQKAQEKIRKYVQH